MKGKAPREMSRGSATTFDQRAYFIACGSTSVYLYDLSTNKWEKLPLSRYCNSGLCVIDGCLTTVGGNNREQYTNKLFTLEQEKWVEKYPPMHTARSWPAITSANNGDYLIVIGGLTDDCSYTCVIELFTTKTRRWYKLTNLTEALPKPSATVCDDKLYVVGFSNKGYSCSLQNLPSGEEPNREQLTYPISWTQLPCLPVTGSTPATLSGELILIGGREGGLQGNSIHQLVNGKWVEIGTTSSGRYECLVIRKSPGELMIVGGKGAEDGVEDCVITNILTMM